MHGTTIKKIKNKSEVSVCFKYAADEVGKEETAASLPGDSRDIFFHHDSVKLCLTTFFPPALYMCWCKFLTMQQMRKSSYASCVRSLTCHHLPPVTLSDCLNGSRYRPKQVRDILTGWRKWTLVMQWNVT